MLRDIKQLFPRYLGIGRNPTVLLLKRNIVEDFTSSLFINFGSGQVRA